VGVEAGVTLIDVSASTSDARRREVGRFAISEVSFASNCRLPSHAHPRACIAVVVAGVVRKSYARQTHEAKRATVVTMPAQEQHSDLFGRAGARLVVVEFDDGANYTSAFTDWSAAALAHRIRQELAQPDAFSDLALEGLALELQAAVSRHETSDARAPWLDDAAAILCNRLRDPPSVDELAGELGVEPGRLVRCFRDRYRQSVGGYVRQARLEWAADLLLQTDTALARIACEAGFADQSHFTRTFAARFGVPPGRYRRARR
jgi:AraC family transcriptional regulator